MDMTTDENIKIEEYDIDGTLFTSYNNVDAMEQDSIVGVHRNELSEEMLENIDGGAEVVDSDELEETGLSRRSDERK